MKRKEYNYTVVEYDKWGEVWKHQTNDIAKAYKWLTDGICDSSGAMYCCYYFGEYYRVAYNKAGHAIDINAESLGRMGTMYGAVRLPDVPDYEKAV